MTLPRARAERCLSVVMPCYNEERTLAEVAQRVLSSPFTGELVIVDDGSTDSTLSIARSLRDPRVRVFAQPFNMGKGVALRRGFQEVTCDYVIVQDADLEYDPADYEKVLRPLLAGEADVVYGSRFAGGDERRVLYYWHTVGNRLLTTFSNALTNLNLTDMETCYKAFRREVIQGIEIHEDRFGFEPEITAKLAAGGWRIYEVGIAYHGRTYAEGKKITWRDGVRAFYCMLRYSPMRPRLRRHRRGPATFDEADATLAKALDDLDVATGNYADWIVAMIDDHVGTSVLEVGAGHGTITERLRRPGRRIVATDLSARCVAALKERFDGAHDVRVKQGDVRTCAEDEVFDTVVMINVLEHIDDDVGTLRDVHDALTPGGHVAVFVPAFEGLYSRFDAEVGHVRRYRRSELATALSRAGFEVPVARYVNLPGAFGWWLVARQLGRRPTDRGLASFYDRTVVPMTRRLEQRIEPPFGQSLLCIGRKALS
ncbi:MAG TPA: glycosyltransferase [Acidimicrobiales bacterium]